MVPAKSHDHPPAHCVICVNVHYQLMGACIMCCHVSSVVRNNAWVADLCVHLIWHGTFIVSVCHSSRLYGWTRFRRIFCLAAGPRLDVRCMPVCPQFHKMHSVGCSPAICPRESCPTSTHPFSRWRWRPKASQRLDARQTVKLWAFSEVCQGPVM